MTVRDKESEREAMLPAHVEVVDALPALPLPPSSVLKIAFLTAVRYGGVRRAYAQYRRAIAERAGSVRELAGLANANGELQEAIARLFDIQTILDADDAVRREEKAEALHAETLGKLRREREECEERLDLAEAKQNLRQFHHGDGRDAGDAEIRRKFDAVSTRQQIRAVAEQFKAEIVREAGGEEYFTKEQQDELEDINEIMEQELRNLALQRD